MQMQGFSLGVGVIMLTHNYVLLGITAMYNLQLHFVYLYYYDYI